MSDCVVVRGIRVFVRHGVLPEERERHQELRVDLVVRADLERAASSDDLADTVDYGELAERVAERVTAESWSLLERVAGRVAELVLEDERVQEVEVTVHKVHPPITVSVEDVSVTVVRSR